MEDDDLSPHALQARDEILDLLVQGQKVRAIQRYIQASGKGLSQARTVIDRLSQLLEKPGLDAAEQAFLGEFRASLEDENRAASQHLASETPLAEARRDGPPGADALEPVANQPTRLRAPRAAATNRTTPLRIDWEDFFTGGGALMLFLSLICIGGSLYTLTQGSDQDSWIGVPGTITQARLAAPTQPGKPWRAIFAYEYEVDGKTYSADRYSFENVDGARSLGIERHDPGDPVTVFYNPQSPSIAVLAKKKPGFFVFVVLLFGIAFLLASIGCLLARDFTALFSRSGVADLWQALSSRAEPTAEAPWDRSLREVEEQLRESLESGVMEPERAAEMIRYATELDLETCRELAQALAAGRAIDLSPQSIRDLQERSERSMARKRRRQLTRDAG